MIRSEEQVEVRRDRWTSVHFSSAMIFSTSSKAWDANGGNCSHFVLVSGLKFSDEWNCEFCIRNESMTSAQGRCTC
jgi:hypothetical protein